MDHSVLLTQNSTLVVTIRTTASYFYGYPQALSYGKHLDNIMSLQNTLRKIGRDKSFSENQLSKSMIERLEAISNAEYVIYTYYPILACAVVNGRITARQFGSIIYDSGYQYEKLKGGNYLDGTNANAFVHTMWNAYIYTSLIKQHKYDSTTAEQLTWLASAMHEYSDAGAKKNLGWLSNVNMDLYNNSKGIEIAKQLIDNKYLTGILGQHDNWESREVDIAINIVNAVSEGRLLLCKV